MLHIIQNDPEVPPGNLLEHLTVPHLIHHPYQGEQLPDAREIHAMIVLGGAMGANDDLKHPFLKHIKELIRQMVASGKPYLGICLGGQLLAAAFNALVASGRWEELGTSKVELTEEGKTDRLFRGMTPEFTTFQWHHDSFDIPPDGILLASSDRCPNQAFRIGSNAWGLQFHPEVTEAIIRDWCAWDSSLLEITETMVADFNAINYEYYRTSRKLCDNFL